MRVLITGVRDFVDPRIIAKSVEDSGFDVTSVITGTFHGVEQQVQTWAKEAGLPVELFKPDWAAHRLKAGEARTDTMLNAADAVIVIWTGNDRSKMVVDLARKKKKPTHVHHV